MRLNGIEATDIVQVNIKGRKFLAVVTEVGEKQLRFEPIGHNISYFTCTSRQVENHWKRARYEEIHGTDAVGSGQGTLY